MAINYYSTYIFIESRSSIIFKIPTDILFCKITSTWHKKQLTNWN